MLAWPDPIPLVYGTERTDVRDAGACDSADVGFVAIWNWGNLGSDGTHTVVVEDDGMELAQSTVQVTMVGPESQPQFLRGASGECRIPDFPTPGESTLFEWNQNTQHLEAVMRDPSTDLDTVPSLAHATTLENPGNGLPYSGVGVISGWKCETSGPLTAHIYDEDMMLAGRTRFPWCTGPSGPMFVTQVPATVRMSASLLSGTGGILGVMGPTRWSSKRVAWSLPRARFR